MITITILVREQIKQGVINTILDDQEEKTNLEEADVCDWIIKPRTIGKKLKKKIELFIEVMSKVHLGLLIKSNIGLLKEENLSL